ncbi:methyl-accepting chemotaxis protein [Sodalinema gerasimenkoae]|uniref:methyl-accepting chemotaxis protein n=1 Tax=Sodalinema gerasimenkoae TaxID=2862348 RepID=UPI001356F5A7|nr:methyl-accepting chemotaxis protein [Sodalinema gerasimenkoae]
MNTKQFQRYLVGTSAVGIFVIGALVALVAILPLSERLKEGEQRKLEFAATTQAQTIEEILSRLTNIAMQVSSRTRARQELQAYNQGDLEREPFVTSNQAILGDALQQSPDIVGITRLDANNALAIQLGQTIPTTFWIIPDSSAQTPEISPPLQLDNNSYFLLVASPILTPQGQRVGTDLVLFDVSNLQILVEQGQIVGESGVIALGQRQNGRSQLFFDHVDANYQAQFEQVIAEASAEGVQLELLEGVRGEMVIASTRLANYDWVVAVKLDSAELYESIMADIRNLAGILVILTLVGSGVMVLLLRPLAGQAIVETEDLEQKLKEAQELLALRNTALEQQRQKEQYLQAAMDKIERLRSSAREVSHQSEQAESTSKTALTLVHQGAEDVANALSGTQALQQQIQDILDEMQRLNDSTDRITVIARLVGDMASQTNMLALNAAVEAVRAGEKGKGFAVVATEIRKLADQSHQSAERIRHLSTEIQTAIRSTSTATRLGTERADSGVRVAGETAQVFATVRESIQAVAQTTNRIAQVNHHQAQEIESLVQTLHDLDDLR